MQLLRRTDSLDMVSTPISPATSNNSSTYSRFSFAGFSSSSSISSTGSRALSNQTNGITSSTILPRDSTTFTAKIVFGIWQKNYKAGLLFTRSDDISSTPARLIFLPDAFSFKSELVDQPALILANLITAFKFARSNIPSTSRFSGPFTNQNLFRLQELLELAKLWEECGQVESKFMISRSMHTVSMVDGSSGSELVRRLLKQPNIYEILREAFDMLSCVGLGIPRTSPTSSLARSTWKKGSTSGLRRSTSPLCDDARDRLNEVGPIYRNISHTDSITSLHLSDIDKLLNEFSTVLIPLSIYYAPFEDQDDVVSNVADCLGECLGAIRTSAAGAVPKEEDVGTPAEKEAISVSGVAVAMEWAKDAMKLRNLAQDSQAWINAMGHCRRIRSGIAL